MYTKTGLSALAIAGLSLGVVGMLTSTGGASAADCRAPSSGVTAPATSGDGDANAKGATDTSKDAAKDSDKKKAKPGNKGTNKPANGSKGSNGSNGAGGSGNLLEIDGRTKSPGDTGINAKVPNNGGTPTVDTTPGSPSSSSPPFLDLLGTTQATNAPGGNAVPPTATRVIGRSSFLGNLIHVRGRANAGR